VVGDWVATTMSNNVVTYLVAPIWTLMETRMTEYLSKNIGWKGSGEGVPTSGCGAANSLALSVALYGVDSKIKDIGIVNQKKKLT